MEVDGEKLGGGRRNKNADRGRKIIGGKGREYMEVDVVKILEVEREKNGGRAREKMDVEEEKI